jgi:hypothetical protein
MPAAKYAQGQDAWGLCKRCGLRFLLGDLVFDGFMPSMRVCKECYDGKQQQEFHKPVTDPQALYSPSPDDGPIPPVLMVTVAGATRVLDWSPANPNGGARVKAYEVFRQGVMLASLPVRYWEDNVSLADLNENGGPSEDNQGIESQTLTFTTNFAQPALYQVFAQLDSKRSAASNLVSA